MKRDAYANSKQFESVNWFSNVVLRSFSNIPRSLMETTYFSLPDRILRVINKNGGTTDCSLTTSADLLFNYIGFLNCCLFLFSLYLHLLFFYYSLKTGFLKWKPDYDQAADEYNRAGEICQHKKILIHHQFCIYFLLIFLPCFFFFFFLFEKLKLDDEYCGRSC